MFVDTLHRIWKFPLIYIDRIVPICVSSPFTFCIVVSCFYLIDFSNHFILICFCEFQSIPVSQPLQRKKSLPDVQGLPRAMDAMSREEVSMLGSARREEIRKMADESERLRANPLLYLVSPQVKVSNR